jgi:hypothetical protein
VEYGIRLRIPKAAPEDPRDLFPPEWLAFLPAGPLTALYFGTEFCEDRLPDPSEALSFCRLAEDGGWQAAFLTPVVTTDGLARLSSLLAALTDAGFRPAVVFNDWGVLGLLRESRPELPARAGRLLNRALRDPRALARDHTPGSDRKTDPERGRRLRGFLAGFGVGALETDPDLEGGYLGDGADGLQRTLHLPYAFASTGRNCLCKAEVAPGMGISALLQEPCSAPCRGPALRADREDCPRPLWRAGNTIFYEVPRDAAEAHAAQADRIVVHEGPSP